MSVPNGMKEVRQAYGSFKFTELSGGNVRITDSWPRDNLVVLHDVLGLGLSVQLHGLVAPRFIRAFQGALGVCPQYHVRMLGGFCARHKMHDPKRELSIHSWGAAVDINWDTNGIGNNAPHDIPRDFIEAFVGEGWEYGGDWPSNPDWMHFQLATGC